MKVITVCGSMKFYKEMLEIAEKMELKGNCVLVPIASSLKKTFTADEIEMLGKMHKEKIKIADAILVVNIDGYIGQSTQQEIVFAQSLNKEIMYYTDLL